MDEDLKLIAIIKGDLTTNSAKQKAFTCLYNKYQDVVKNYIRKIASGADEFTKEEIFSVTMGKAFTKIQSFDIKYPMIVWLKKIALNTFIDSWRRKSPVNLSLSEVSESTKSDGSYCPYTKVVQKQLESDVHHFIKRLSSKHSEVVKLRLNNNFSCKQISDKLKLPLGTVTTILHRSRILFKKSVLSEI